jgi:hypothetical protein
MTRYEEIFHGFLQHQQEQGQKLADDSDLLQLFPVGNSPAQRYIARYSCRGLIRTAEGEIQEADRFDVGIYFDREYLRQAGPHVLTWLGPREVFHPNISDRAPVACIGTIRPANQLVDLLYRVWQVITYRKKTTNEFDALNAVACQYARNHPSRFPIDPRPLKRQTRHIQALVSERSPRP